MLMDIGAKIRDARVKSGLTQEQAAEALSVSRQTISNWETGKTYPDIVSVVRMSDLYDIKQKPAVQADPARCLSHDMDDVTPCVLVFYGRR